MFSGAAVSDIAGDPARAAAFVVGTTLGSLALHLGLAGAMSALGARLGERSLRVIDAVSGVGLRIFGGLLAVRTVTGTTRTP